MADTTDAVTQLQQQVVDLHQRYFGAFRTVFEMGTSPGVLGAEGLDPQSAARLAQLGQEIVAETHART